MKHCAGWICKYLRESKEQDETTQSSKMCVGRKKNIKSYSLLFGERESEKAYDAVWMEMKIELAGSVEKRRT